MRTAPAIAKRPNYATIASISVGIVFCGFVAMTLVSAAYIIFAYQGKSIIDALAEVLRDEEFQITVLRTVIFSLTCVALKALLAWLIVPLFATPKQNRLGSLVLLPWILPASIGSLSWLWFFNDIGGGANLILAQLGFATRVWFGTPRLAFWLIVAFNVWRETPLWAIALGSGLFAPEDSLSSLALGDGLNARARIRLLLLPRIMPILIALGMLSFIWSAAEFDSVWLLTRGGPGDATEFVTVYAFRHAILSQNLARGAAAYICFAPVMGIILFWLMLLYRRAVERGRV